MKKKDQNKKKLISSNNKNKYNTNSSTSIKLVELGGPKGPEPTRYGDWEKNGRCSDF